MSERVRVDDITAAFDRILSNYVNVSTEVCEKAISETTKETVNELHNVHVAGSEKYGSWDNYNKSWKSKKTNKGLGTTIYNEKYYRLTHLLEKGHAFKNGGRARAFPHIAPIADKAEETLLKKVKNGL